MTRDVGAVVLVLVGGAILRISLGVTYLNYVKESLRPWLLLSGAVLVVLGLLTMLDIWRASRSPAADDPAAGAVAADPAEAHEHAPPRAAWLLLLPVLAIFLVAPPALGAFSAERETAFVTAPESGSEVPALPAGDPVALSLGDYASRAVWDEGRSLSGRTVELTGFVSAAPGGGWYLTRLALSCCAADAFATKVTVLEPPYQPPVDTWVTITGAWVPGGATQSETAIPWVRAVEMAEVLAPTDPYE